MMNDIINIEADVADIEDSSFDKPFYDFEQLRHIGLPFDFIKETGLQLRPNPAVVVQIYRNIIGNQNMYQHNANNL